MHDTCGTYIYYEGVQLHTCMIDDARIVCICISYAQHTSVMHNNIYIIAAFFNYLLPVLFFTFNAQILLEHIVCHKT